MAGTVDGWIERRWTRYGKDRVYLSTPDSRQVGYVNLVERTWVVEEPGHDADLQECFERWAQRLALPDIPGPVPPSEPERGAPDLIPLTVPASDLPQPIVPVTTLPAPTLLPPNLTTSSPPPADSGTSESPGVCGPIDRDLTGNVAGQAARAKRDEVNAEAPILNFVARVFGVKTEERAWRVGAKGEEKVSTELAKLGPEWHTLHAVEVGDRGSDIDHVLIGPSGVFTLNSKRHPNGKAWVAERVVMVNGQRTDYLRNSRHEAARAGRLLTAACGFEVAARAVVVFVDLDTFTVKQMPSDVYVATRKRLTRWLHSQPAVIDAPTIAAIFAAARRSSTWT